MTTPTTTGARRLTSRQLRAPLVALVVGVVDDVTNVTLGDAVVIGVEDGVLVTEPMPLTEKVVGFIDGADVNGATAVDSEEMSEERAERRDGAAVVSKDNVLNGRPLVLQEPPKR